MSCWTADASSALAVRKLRLSGMSVILPVNLQGRVEFLPSTIESGATSETNQISGYLCLRPI
jgi:hypothetical protein